MIRSTSLGDVGRASGSDIADYELPIADPADYQKKPAAPWPLWAKIGLVAVGLGVVGLVLGKGK